MEEKNEQSPEESTEKVASPFSGFEMIHLGESGWFTVPKIPLNTILSTKKPIIINEVTTKTPVETFGAATFWQLVNKNGSPVIIDECIVFYVMDLWWTFINGKRFSDGWFLKSDKITPISRENIKNKLWVKGRIDTSREPLTQYINIVSAGI